MILKTFEKVEITDMKITLGILENASGTVQVHVVNDAGKPMGGGCLITFYPDGTQRLARNISAKFGFQLDSNGKIITNTGGM